MKVMEYLTQPIEVREFDLHFRTARGSLLNDTDLVAFTQTERRWKATYQCEDMSITFTGDVAKTRAWLREEKEEQK